jgi:Zeta toxin
VLLKGELPPRARVVYEGQLAKPETTIPKLQQAIDAGLRPVIMVVHARPENALDNTIRRFGEEGRGASINVMASIQAGLPACLNHVHQHFGDAIDLQVVDRREISQVQVLKGWHHLQVLESEGNHEQIKHRLSTALDHHRAAGTVNEACYRQAAGLAPGGLDGRVDSERSDRLGQDGDRPGVPEEGSRARPSLTASGRLTPDRTPIVDELRNDALKQLDELGAKEEQGKQAGQVDQIDQARAKRPERGGTKR